MRLREDIGNVLVFGFLFLFVLAAGAIKASDHPAIQRRAAEQELAYLGRLETERNNIRDHVIGGAVAHHSGIDEANRLANLRYARWYPNAAHGFMHPTYEARLARLRQMLEQPAR